MALGINPANSERRRRRRRLPVDYRLVGPPPAPCVHCALRCPGCRRDDEYEAKGSTDGHS